jgi:hypothetical protein
MFEKVSRVSRHARARCARWRGGPRPRTIRLPCVTTPWPQIDRLVQTADLHAGVALHVEQRLRVWTLTPRAQHCSRERATQKSTCPHQYISVVNVPPCPAFCKGHTGKRRRPGCVRDHRGSTARALAARLERACRFTCATRAELRSAAAPDDTPVVHESNRMSAIRYDPLQALDSSVRARRRSGWCRDRVSPVPTIAGALALLRAARSKHRGAGHDGLPLGLPRPSVRAGNGRAPGGSRRAVGVRRRQRRLWRLLCSELRRWDRLSHGGGLRERRVRERSMRQLCRWPAQSG